MNDANPSLQPEFNALDWLNLLWRRRKLFIVPFIVVTGLCLGIGTMLPKGYESKTITKIIDRTYLQRLYHGLDVAPPPAINSSVAQFEIKNKDEIARILDDEKMLADKSTPEERQSMIDKIREYITIDVASPKTGGDQLLTITFTGETPYQAQRIVNRVTQSYINRLKARYRESVREQRDKALNEFNRTSTTYEEYEDQLRQFEEQNHEYIRGGETPALDQAIERDQEKIEELVTEMLQLETEIKQHEFNLNGIPPEIVEHERERNILYDQQMATVMQLKAQLERLKLNRLPDHPVVTQAEEELKKAQAELVGMKQYTRNREVRKANPKHEQENLAIQTKQSKYDLLANQRQKLYARYEKRKMQQKRLPTILGEHKKRTDSRDRAAEERAMWQQRYWKSETTWSRVNSTLPDLFVSVESASRPLKHSTPPPYLIMLISLALGLASALALVFFVELGRKTFHSPEDVTAFLPWPVIGVVHTILSQQEVQQRQRKRAAAIVATLILVIGLCTVAYVYNRNPDLLPDIVRTSMTKFRDLI